MNNKHQPVKNYIDFCEYFEVVITGLKPCTVINVWLIISRSKLIYGSCTHFHNVYQKVCKIAETN